jgi:hypothetical protein
MVVFVGIVWVGTEGSSPGPEFYVENFTPCDVEIKVCVELYLLTHIHLGLHRGTE